MREIFVDRDSTKVGYFKSVLDGAGIPNFIRNEHTNLITEIPSHLFYPTLCVIHDEDYDTAIELLETVHHSPPQSTPDWTCPQCGEQVPGNFDSCWQCGTERVNA